jgi:hypothetical protein
MDQNRPLRPRGLRGLRGRLGERVHLCQREVPEHEREVLPHRGLDGLHLRVGGAAERALVVAVLDERDRCVE